MFQTLCLTGEMWRPGDLISMVMVSISLPSCKLIYPLTIHSCNSNFAGTMLDLERQGRTRKEWPWLGEVLVTSRGEETHWIFTHTPMQGCGEFRFLEVWCEKSYPVRAESRSLSSVEQWHINTSLGLQIQKLPTFLSLLLGRGFWIHLQITLMLLMPSPSPPLALSPFRVF